MAYRKALVRLMFARNVGLVPEVPVQPTNVGRDIPLAPITPGSVLEKNQAVHREHYEEFEELKMTGFYTMQ